MARNDNEVESFHKARAREISFYFLIIALCIWGVYDYIITKEIHFQWTLLLVSILIFFGVKSFLMKKKEKTRTSI